MPSGLSSTLKRADRNIATFRSAARNASFSEIADFLPCRLCWFQRIAMYPLSIILSMAAVRRDRGVFLYALALAAIGAVVSGYHVREQLWPPETTSCDLFNPCSARWVDAFGVFTIPEMASASFVAILVFGVIALRTGLSQRV